MDYTLGEIVVETHTNGSTILTQGFHQEVLEITTKIVNIDIKTKVYPNPTTSILIVELEKNVNADIMVYDINGKLVIKDRLNNEQKKQLDFSFLKQGNYLLHINIADKQSVYQINKTK
jgi:Tol biopolymer transport system component